MRALLKQQVSDIHHIGDQTKEEIRNSVQMLLEDRNLIFSYETHRIYKILSKKK